ncbi:MAG TPA: ATP-binding cassette domain-containing protein [Gemmatimonadaceae bacterium]|nr:ATP-binding cassette domain-containing protein [Gemmatimonadaceae bacterium]
MTTFAGPRNAIEIRALRKVYKGSGKTKPPGSYSARGSPPGSTMPPSGDVVALDSLDLDIHAGEFFGLLGPNGAGKSTAIGVLTTRIRPTSGAAIVGGADVVKDSVRVRQTIGVVPQRPNADLSLNVLENLQFHAAYFGISSDVATKRAFELLERLGLSEKSGSKLAELSGGQQQRLMIVRALMHEPEIIFLDEPTVGLDPQARLGLWDILRDLHDRGRTIVMTTHYMDEADRLCDRLAIIDQGKLLALDTPDALKRKAPGGTLLELVLDGDAMPAAEIAETITGISRVEARDGLLRAHSTRGAMVLPALIEAAESAGRTVKDIHLLQPSLETLFVSLTGRKLE